VSVSIDDIAVVALALSPKESGETIHFLEFPLLSAGAAAAALQSSHSLRIAVFDEAGDDLQPDIISEFHLVTCHPPFDVARARQSLIATHVRMNSFA
jgi:hypothetical protein